MFLWRKKKCEFIWCNFCKNSAGASVGKAIFVVTGQFPRKSTAGSGRNDFNLSLSLIIYFFFFFFFFCCCCCCYCLGLSFQLLILVSVDIFVTGSGIRGLTTISFKALVSLSSYFRAGEPEFIDRHLRTIEYHLRTRTKATFQSNQSHKRKSRYLKEKKNRLI